MLSYSFFFLRNFVGYFLNTKVFLIIYLIFVFLPKFIEFLNLIIQSYFIIKVLSFCIFTYICGVNVYVCMYVRYSHIHCLIYN